MNILSIGYDANSIYIETDNPDVSRTTFVYPKHKFSSIKALEKEIERSISRGVNRNNVKKDKFDKIKADAVKKSISVTEVVRNA